jgi:hypothetical protein
MRTPKTNFRRHIKILLALACAGFLLPATAAYAQSAKLEIDHLEKLADKAAEVVDVTIDGSLLQLAARFMSDKRGSDEAAAKDLVQHLKGIYVKSFEFDKEGEYSLSDVEEIRKQLHTPAWQRTVEIRTKRGGENTEVYLMPGSGTGADAIQGLAIICAEPKELTVVNIVGPIDLDKLADLDGQMGMPRLGLEHTGKGRKDSKDKKESKEEKDAKEATHHDEAK